VNPQADPLGDLRDIHLPPPVSWWPPAPGWWLLLAAVLLVAGAVFWWLWRHRRERWRRLALRELASLRTQQQHPQNTIKDLSILLRRVALSRFPRKQVAALNGDAWLAFLDQGLGEDAAFASEQGRLLAVGPYVRETNPDNATLSNLFALSERWIKTLPAGGKR
jgi:ABC-type nickel/cobalt efflux system permease component RcnA